MKKIRVLEIEVTNCCACPAHDPNSRYCGKEERHIDFRAALTFPSWCPLKERKKKFKI